MSYSSELNAKFTLWYPAAYQAVVPDAIKGAKQVAHSTTKALASTAAIAEPVSAQIISTGSNVIAQENALTSSLQTFQEAANKACFVDKNPAACSRASQQFGVQTAIVNGPNGPAVRALNALKSRGSVDSYFYYPSWVQALKPTNPVTAGVAVSLSGLNQP